MRMDWAAMGAASSAYAEASRARSENQELWQQNQRLSYELGQLQNVLGQYQNGLAQIQEELGQHQNNLDELRKDIARRKAMEEYQAWIEEFIYKFDKAVTNISSTSTHPINDYDVIASFLDIINTNSLDTSRIRGLENKSAFEQTFSKAQNLFNELVKTPEVQEHLRLLRQQEEARREQKRLQELARIEQLRRQEEARREQKRQQELARIEREQLEQQKADIAAESRAQVKKFVVVGALFILGLVLIFGYMEYRSSTAEEEKRQAQQALQVQQANAAEEKKRQAQQANAAEEDRRQEAMIDIQRATEGDSEAQIKAGWRYYEGRGVTQDRAKALEWLQKAADQGHYRAEHIIRWMKTQQ